MSDRYEIDLTTVPPGKETGLVEDQDALCAMADKLQSPTNTVVDREVWKTNLGSDGYQRANVRRLVPSIKSQTGPSCTSNQTVNGVQLVRAIMGLDHVELSAASVFAFVGGRGGSTVKDNLDRIVDVGCVPETMWASSRIYNRSKPAGFDETAPRYRMREPLWVPDFAAASWELLCGHPVGFGVRWGAGGHSILGTRVVFDGRKWGWEIENSWGEGWGDSGFGVLWEPQISSGIRSRYGAVAYRYAVHY